MAEYCVESLGTTQATQGHIARNDSKLDVAEAVAAAAVLLQLGQHQHHLKAVSSKWPPAVASGEASEVGMEGGAGTLCGR